MHAEECDYLRAKAEPRLHPSAVTDFKRPGTPQTTINQGRTSTGTFFARQEDDVIAGIEQRIARWTMVASENSEELQVLRYQVQRSERPGAEHPGTIAHACQVARLPQ